MGSDIFEHFSMNTHGMMSASRGPFCARRRRNLRPHKFSKISSWSMSDMGSDIFCSLFDEKTKNDERVAGNILRSPASKSATSQVFENVLVEHV